MKTVYHETIHEEIEVGEDIIEVEFFGDFSSAAPEPGWDLDGIHWESWRCSPEENKIIEKYLSENWDSIAYKLCK